MAKTSRRKFLLTAFSAIGLGAIILWFTKNSILRWIAQRTDNKGLIMTAATPIDDDICILTSSQTEGPFFISSPIRKNVIEDRQGKEMLLRMQIVNYPVCTPIEGAIIEIWHCDAEGIYSGYPEEISHDPWKAFKFMGTGEGNIKPVTPARFLRGAQQSDADGIVEFNTIFPGWYDGRTPHIHFKILVDNKEQLTSQFYFEHDFCNKIYLHMKPYNNYGESPYTPQNDIVINGDINAVNGLLLNPKFNIDQPISSSIKVGIRKIA
jgi:protocatechuate 3,4-dioxygenase beta subunit